MAVTVTRSPLRLLAHVLLGVPAILLAIDMTLSNAFYPAPHAVDTVVGSTLDQFGDVVDVTGSALTQQGQAEARRDRVFAAVLLAGGFLSVTWAMRELMKPRALLQADRDGLSVRLVGPDDTSVRSFSWHEVVEVRSGVADEDGEALPVLVVRTLLPDEDETETLSIVTDDWSPPVHLAVPLVERMSPKVPAGDDGA